MTTILFPGYGAGVPNGNGQGAKPNGIVSSYIGATIIAHNDVFAK